MIAVFLIGLIAGDPLPVRLVAPAGPHYVGQPIELKVITPASSKEIRVELPRLVGGEIRGSGREDGFFRLVPRRSGPLVIAPIRIRLGDRSGASRPLTIAIQEPPLSGRPSTFLGGVGELRVESELKPASARVGEAVEYQIRLIGLGAIGSVRRPTVNFAAGNPLAIRSEPIAEESADEPPSRTFRFRLRASTPGESAIPPVAISTFDPVSGRYQTHVSASQKIRISEISEFDPSAIPIDTGPISGEHREPLAILAMIGVAALGLLAAIGLGIRSRKRPASPYRLFEADLERIDLSAPADAVAIAILAAITDDLARRLGRPKGVLTPAEARSWLARSTENPPIAEEAARLVESCDRVLYAGEAIPVETLMEQARRLLAGLRLDSKRGRQER